MMLKTVSALGSALGTIDAGLSMAERFDEKHKHLVPKFLYRNAYYFEEVNKKVFVKTNGDGVVVCSCDLYVINPEAVEHFVRLFDISDAPKATKFPPFDSISKSKNDFFNGYAFWHESESGIISGVEEYCDDDFTHEEVQKIAERRLLGVRFFINKNKLESKRKYRIVYGYSVPKLFPIKNGKHDSSDYSKKTYKYTSSMSVKRMAKKLRLSVYFEDGICIEDAPRGNAIKVSNNQSVPSDICQVRDNILYTKYLYEVKRPEKYNSIQIKWKLE